MEQLALCELDFFDSKNIFTGSLGDFRYRVAPVDGKLEASTYYTYCYEKADPIITEMFEKSEEGYAKLREWLVEQSQTEKKQ